MRSFQFLHTKTFIVWAKTKLDLIFANAFLLLKVQYKRHIRPNQAISTHFREFPYETGDPCNLKMEKQYKEQDTNI